MFRATETRMSGDIVQLGYPVRRLSDRNDYDDFQSTVQSTKCFA